MSLKISKDLTLPPDAITQTFSILAQRRVGKTYTASVMAEEFVANSLPFVALDPTGAWWGLRASADGNKEGLPVVIIGGDHGDVPLEPTAGRVIADLVVDHPGCYVVDLSSTESNAEQDRFAMDFAERLYRRKGKVRTPLHLFVDEADAFAPQRPLPGQLRMLGAFETLVRRGGIRGIGTTLITQRAAVLNKNVLTQTDSLFVLRMNSPQDQDAIDDWVKRHGTREQRDIMMNSLASLPQGESWFWSPGWLGKFEKILIRKRRTFNSSATPKAGEKVIVPQKLAPVDLDRLGKDIAATIERASENDPSALKRKVAELRQKLAKVEQMPAKVAPPATKIETVEVPILTMSQEGLLSIMSKTLIELKGKMEDANHLMRTMTSLSEDVTLKIKALVVPKPIKPVPLRPAPARPLPTPKRTEPVEAVNGEGVSKCERAILTALAQYPEGRTVIQIAVLSCYSSGSGGFKNSLGRLRSLEYITRTNPIQITDAGLTALGEWQPLPVGQELAGYWLPRLSKCESQIFTHLMEIHPDGANAQDIGERIGYSPGSGGFKNSLGRLRTLELITRGYPIRASDHLFQ